MKIGIIVYSQTGNTFFVVKRLKEELEKKGNEVGIERLEPINSDDVHPKAKEIEYEKLPDLTKYDAYIFASPTQAFSLSTGMKSYLKDINNLNNKQVACFVTKGLPFNWTGGTRAVKQMTNILKTKDANIVETGIIKWTKKSKEKDIENLITKLVNKF